MQCGYLPSPRRSARAPSPPVSHLSAQEAALEGLLDLVRQPSFVHDMFVNCDCRVERANLFEEVRAALADSVTMEGTTKRV
jgi:hypothetical protein